MILVPSLLPGIGRLLKSDYLQDLKDHGSRLGLGLLMKATQGQTKEARNLVETAFVEAVEQAA